MNAGSLRSAAHQASPRPPLQGDPADQSVVGIAGGAQHEVVSLDEVDEAGVHATRVGEQAHDGAQYLVELERRADGRDDPCQNLVAADGAHRHRPYRTMPVAQLPPWPAGESLR